MAEKRPLTGDDYRRLEASYITREIADAAGLYRIASLDGRELVGQRGGGEFGGIVFTYRINGLDVAHRLRVDAPPIVDGKPRRYFAARESRNRLYFPPAPIALLSDPTVPLIITEGEKKCLALWRMALETANGNGKPAFLPVALPGVNSWRGTIGAKNNAEGERVQEKGVIPDLDLIAWNGRRVIILFDANVVTNQQVYWARQNLARVLYGRDAQVYLPNLPPGDGINGCDDFLAAHGTAKLARVLDEGPRYDWKSDLIEGKNGPLGHLENVLVALHGAPEWRGVLGYDEFARDIVALKPTPWGKTGSWDDQQDGLTAAWCQRRGIKTTTRTAFEAVEIVARETAFHPVRDFLNGLVWDGTKRLDKWLTTYLGVADDPLTRAVGAKWMIGAVARIFRPGEKVDHVLVLEGPQGAFKSRACRVLGEPWFTDDISVLGTKDAQLGVGGVWIIELAELDALLRSQGSTTKAFLTRQRDRFRPPYGRRLVEGPRECSFIGTINSEDWARDDTGARRFWPVACGQIDIVALQRDRDQLWAEAVARFQKREEWWLDESCIALAQEAQAERLPTDPWQAAIAEWLEKADLQIHKNLDRKVVTTEEVLSFCINKPKADQNKPDTMRVAVILRKLGWSVAGREPKVGEDGRPTKQRRLYAEPAEYSNPPTKNRVDNIFNDQARAR